MIVVSVNDCPPKLRGDLSKWLFEINTGVYVGRVSMRVREELWKRICENLPNGRATMVFPAANEQRLSFYVHNTSWQPRDFDGLTLMCRPSAASPRPEGGETPAGQSRMGQQLRVQRIRSAQAAAQRRQGYVIIDVETTGLDSAGDEIIELAAVRIIDHAPAAQMAVFVRTERALSQEIVKLTGITPQMLEDEGVALAEAIHRFREFVQDSPMVSHNIAFDRAFLVAACEKLGQPPMRNPCKDTLTLARSRLDDVPNYKLSTLAEYFNIPMPDCHRALSDCMTTFQLYEKLNEID